MRFYQNWTGIVCDNVGKEMESFPAQVPSNIQRDFAKHKGMLDSLQYSTNASALDKYRNSYWKYRTQLDFCANPDEKVFFVAEGIDYEFDILLDGEKLWHQEGMYTPVELDITEKAGMGGTLEVVIYPHPCAPNSVPGTRDEARESCKPPVTYGWDWNPHLLISGMWKPAYIECRKADYIESCELFYELDAEKMTVQIHFETECSGEVTYCLYDENDSIVYEGTLPDFTLNNVELWWCNGYGKPYLYHWTARSKSYEVSGSVGFRTVRLLKNEGTLREPVGFPKSRYAAPITIELNGKRIFAKGSNFVNPELFFGEVTRERNAELVAFAKEANMNIFRIWGGAGICKEHFYEECDKNGIMVWQEFMLACNEYIGTDKLLATLEQEATSILKNYRKYTSIILWCGGNELFNGWSKMDDQSLPLRLLNKLCYEYDKKRPFLATSPLTGMAHGGYVFLNDDLQDVFTLFGNAHNTAYTEFGVPSITDKENLKKIIPENELFPIEKTESWIYHHGFGAWGDKRWCCLDVLEHYFGKPKSIDDCCEQSSWLQCAGYQAIFEEARRQWPYCSMSINWCYNEPWITAAGNSLITYPNKLKPAYYAVKNALRSQIPTAKIARFDWSSGEKFSAELCYLNDLYDKTEDVVEVSLVIGDNEYKLLTWDTETVPECLNKVGPSANIVLPYIPEADFMILKLKSKHSDRCNEYKLKYYPKAAPKRTMQLNV